jgi:nitrate reductase alpha subunit
LWTSLLAPRQAPALALARLYAQRWEQELYFRDVKRALRRTDLLQSHTVETAAQEIAAIVLASALLAVERTRVANGELPVLRVSFAKMLRVVEAMWFTLEIAAAVLTERQTQHILKRGYQRMQQYITPARRARSCPRAVRQPVTGWPRLMKNSSVEGPFEFTIV